ncbi:nodulin MtN21 family protein [Salix suchowensis]|nr:nodulin MtN21 family protein [Salix suchowensis]
MIDGGQWKPVVGMLVISFAFAIVNLLLKKMVDHGTNNMVIATYRLSSSAIFLAPIAFYWERKSRPKLTASIFCHLFFCAFVGLTLTQYLFLLGLEYISVTFSCAFINTVPVNTFILALLLGEPVQQGRKSEGVGYIYLHGRICPVNPLQGNPLTNSRSEATAAGILNIGDTMISGKKKQNWVAGSMLSFAGCFMWSAWFLMQAKISKIYPCQYSSTAIMSFFGAIQSGFLSLILKRKFSMWILKSKLEIIGVLNAGIIGSGLCYVGMSWCINKGDLCSHLLSPLSYRFSPLCLISLSCMNKFILEVCWDLSLVILGLYILLWGKSTEQAVDCGEKQAHLNDEEENHDTEAQISETNSKSNP